jgi:hypothetical protein
MINSFDSERISSFGIKCMAVRHLNLIRYTYHSALRPKSHSVKQSPSYVFGKSGSSGNKGHSAKEYIPGSEMTGFGKVFDSV